MKKMLSLLALFYWASSFITVNAQLVTGDVVVIRRANTTEILKAEHPDSAVKLAHRRYPIDNLYRWEVEKVGNDTYKFRNPRWGRYLGVFQASKIPGERTTIRVDRQAPDIVWRLIPTSQGYRLQNDWSKLVLTKADNRPGFGMNRLIQDINTSLEKQEWMFDFYSYSLSRADSNKVTIEVKLNYIAVSEATRNRIDNNDCRRLFGYVAADIIEQDANGEVSNSYAAAINPYLFIERDYAKPPATAFSYYQDNLTTNLNKPPFNTVTFKVDEAALKRGKVRLVITTYLATRHKDNDFATYDGLKMNDKLTSIYVLDKSVNRTVLINYNAVGKPGMQMLMPIPGTVRSEIYPTDFYKSDDTHKIWINFTYRVK